MKIYPSILEDSLDTFKDVHEKLSPFFSHFQFDIKDNKFTPGLTPSPKDAFLSFQSISSSTSTCEFHLMVEDFQAYLEEIKELAESDSTIDMDNSLSEKNPKAAEKFFAIFCALIHYGPLAKSNIMDIPRMLHSFSKFQLGIVLSPTETVNSSWNITKHFPLIQLMTVEPGSQGGVFIPDVLDKIDALRTLGYTGDIILDGGVNETTAHIIADRQNKPDAVCPGSYFCKAPKEDVQKRIDALHKILT